MGLVPQFSIGDITKALDIEVSKIEKAIENEIIRVGLQFVSDARISADFADRTGNLRSSIGFILLKNGDIIAEDFELSKRGTDKESGFDKAIQFAEEIAGEGIERGYTLIVVAGMQYAVFVEAMGYDVITSSSFKAEDNLKDAMERLKQLAA